MEVEISMNWDMICQEGKTFKFQISAIAFMQLNIKKTFIH